MTDIMLHENLATHQRALRLAVATVAIPAEKMLPVSKDEREIVKLAIACIDDAIAHQAEILRTLKLARRVLKRQAEFVEEE